jgi:NurA domain
VPYQRKSGDFERARSLGHVPIAESEVVRERLRSYRLFTPEPLAAIPPAMLAPAEQLGTPGEPLRWVIAFDGSPQEVAARDAYPSTRIGYVQIAAVLVHLEEMLGQARQALVDPAVVRASTREALHSIVLPGSNVCRQDSSSVRDSWRAEVYEVFRDYSVEQTPLLDVFMLLVGFSDKRSPAGGVLLARCSSSEACEARNLDVPRLGRRCPVCQGTLYPTDSLRIHEEVSEEHSNLTAMGRLMTCLEHITMVAYLNYLSQRQPRVLAFIGLMMDGPLALFGPQAWLHTPILASLESLRARLAQQNLRAPVVLGIEKSGQFAEHADALGDRLPPRHLMMLPDAYIYQHILTFRPSPGSFFGRDTYYGQKFFYRTAQGQLLTITIPKVGGIAPEHLHDPHHYPNLPDVLGLLDRIGTSLYKDAVIPVALAHSFASIPLRTGSKVLRLLSQELLGLPQA